jgi:hypothetical protein
MAVKKTIELEAKVDKAQKDLDGVAKSVQRIDNNLEEVKDTTGGVAKGVKGIGNALKAAGIGLAIAAFSKLAEVFNQNQKVTDAFNTTFEVLSLAFNDFFNFLSNNISTATGFIDSIFGSKTIKNITEFSRLIGVEILTRVKNLIEGIGGLGSALLKVFSGDFTGAYETASEAVGNLGDAVVGNVQDTVKMDEAVTKVTDKITNYAKSTLSAAKATVDLNKQAEVAAVINQGLIEKYDRQAEQQRQLRDDETKTIEERIAANNRLGEILDEQSEKMLENVDITIRAAQAEYDKNQNQENYIALLEAQNEREGVLAQIEGFRSEQIINRISLEREAADLKKEEDESELERLEEKKQKELELAEAKKQATYDALDATIDAAGAETKIGRALFIAKQAILIKEQIAEAKATLQRIALRASEATVDTAKGAASTAKVGFPQNVPLLIAFAAQAAGIISSVKAAVNAAKGSASAMGGGGGIGGAASAPQAPAFNIVGAAPENQLAQAIGEQEQKPVKAFVVSSDVSNQQALDRNITEEASIG